MRFINCGSVGKPKDGDPRGAFAVLRPAAADGLDVTIERVAYDARRRPPVLKPASPREYAEKTVLAA